MEQLIIITVASILAILVQYVVVSEAVYKGMRRFDDYKQSKKED